MCIQILVENSLECVWDKPFESWPPHRKTSHGCGSSQGDPEFNKASAHNHGTRFGKRGRQSRTWTLGPNKAFCTGCPVPIPLTLSIGGHFLKVGLKNHQRCLSDVMMTRQPCKHSQSSRHKGVYCSGRLPVRWHSCSLRQAGVSGECQEAE